MADFKWFTKWNRDNPTNIFGPAYVVGAVGGAIVVAALVVTWGYPVRRPTSVQTGPRGTGMEVVKFASDRAAVDPSAAAFYTEPAVTPAGGEHAGPGRLRERAGARRSDARTTSTG